MPEAQESKHVEQTTSLPPPPPPLVRPDRQITYDGLPHYEWPDPKPLHDRDTITVDRIRLDIDGPSHRFVIKRGDTVEAFFSHDRIKIGHVTGISHANQEVRVAFSERSNGIWFNVGAIYPAPEPVHQSPPSSRKEKLSKILEEVNAEHAPPGGFTEADRVPRPETPLRPFTIEDHKAFRGRMKSGEVTIDELKAQFRWMRASCDAFKAELKKTYNARQLQNVAGNLGNFGARSNTKEQNADSAYRSLLKTFHLGDSLTWQPMKESFDDVLTRAVEAQTAEDLARYFDARRETREANEKALTNPETREEFRTFLRQKSEGDLSDQQLAAYDVIEADLSRERRRSQVPDTVEKFQSDELTAIEFMLKEGYHDKRQCPLFIVQLTTRVERDAFNELNRKAKQLGGWYSSFKKSDAGFQFLDRDLAERFISLLQGDQNREDVLKARRDRKEQSAADRLHEIASELNARAEETVERSEASLQNTARRADIQAGVRGRAFADQALARTMHSIAEALSTGVAKYLDGIRHKTHVETLDSVLYRAKWARIRSLKREDSDSTYAHSRRIDAEDSKPLSFELVRFAEYPYPSLYKRHLEDAVIKTRTASGAKLASERMRKRIVNAPEYVTFQAEHDIDALRDFLGRAKAAGFDTTWLDRSMEHYSRLERAGISTIHELRAALREYLPHRADARGDDPIRIAERELIGKDLPGFFPTPRPVIERMLELAELEAGQRVLEPSCGKGDIALAVRESEPGVELTAIELNRTLADVLSAKGLEVDFADFLSHEGTYDRILMNPPFEKAQEVDHVRHAYDCLAPGGRLVSVMSEGPFFRQDNRSQEFRTWLDDLGGESEPLPEDAFQGAEAFRETGVRTRLVSLDKPPT